MDKTMDGTQKYRRFSISERLEHWAAFIGFTTLGVTGLVQKFAQASLSKSIIALLGGIETVRLLHRIGAIILMMETIFHFGSVGYKIFVKRSKLNMIPGWDDVRNALDSVLYNLNLKKSKPQQGRYTFDEKFEYWAFIWGTAVMAITGFILWNPIATARLLPGEFIPAAKAAHGGEALLAVLAIIVWHFYHVHIKHFNKSMFTGHLTEEEMLAEHPLELADIKAGVAERPVDAERLKYRQRIFYGLYTVVAAVMLFGVYIFVTFEETAIETVPPAEDVVVFAPLTPTPFPTPFPTNTASVEVPSSWNQGFSELMATKCSQCHSGSGALGGLDLSTYAGLFEGGVSGPAVLPGEPNESPLVVIQSEGNHPGQLSGEELALIRAWIEDGAPEE